MFPGLAQQLCFILYSYLNWVKLPVCLIMLSKIRSLLEGIPILDLKSRKCPKYLDSGETDGISNVSHPFKSQFYI